MSDDQEHFEGYMDGRDLDCPEPSENRSWCYRHGFAVGRSDKGSDAMTTTTAALLALADRAEALAIGARYEDWRAIDDAIYIAVKGREPFNSATAPRYTRSLDAAMTLVPEGYEWAAGTGRAQHMTENGRRSWAWCVSSEGFAMVEELALAATPALALTAGAEGCDANPAGECGALSEDVEDDGSAGARAQR